MRSLHLHMKILCLTIGEGKQRFKIVGVTTTSYKNKPWKTVQPFRGGKNHRPWKPLPRKNFEQDAGKPSGLEATWLHICCQVGR